MPYKSLFSSLYYGPLEEKKTVLKMIIFLTIPLMVYPVFITLCGKLETLHGVHHPLVPSHSPLVLALSMRKSGMISIIQSSKWGQVNIWKLLNFFI